MSQMDKHIADAVEEREHLTLELEAIANALDIEDGFTGSLAPKVRELRDARRLLDMEVESIGELLGLGEDFDGSLVDKVRVLVEALAQIRGHDEGGPLTKDAAGEIADGALRFVSGRWVDYRKARRAS